MELLIVGGVLSLILGVVYLFQGKSAAPPPRLENKQPISQRESLRRAGLIWMGLPVLAIVGLLIYVESINSNTGAEGWIFIFTLMFFGAPMAVSFLLGLSFYIGSFFAKDE